MTSKIFLLDSAGSLSPLEEAAYATERELQQLLLDNPDLLAGDQISPDEELRWVLVGDERGLADTEGGSARWAVDLVFLDQNAILTLVEVKRASNPQIRREVVGQLLEYAANATLTWKVETVRDWFEQRCHALDADPDEVLFDSLGVVEDADGFWSRLEDNLRLGRIRLLFLADRIPIELQRIVEYLNQSMENTEVLAVEVRQFAGETHRTLVPKLLGRRTAVQGKKVTSSGGRRAEPWELPELRARIDASHHPVFDRIVAWGRGEGLTFLGGRGLRSAGVNLCWDEADKTMYPFYLYEKPVALYLNLRKSGMGSAFVPGGPFHEELIHRIEEVVPGRLTSSRTSPSVALEALRDAETLERFLGVLSWALRRMRDRLGASD